MAPNGTLYVCCAPRISCNYKAELLGILLGSHFGPHNSVIRVDCQGAISAELSERRPMKEAYWVLAVGDSLGTRNQSVLWVEGHSGEEYNETADYFAKIATQLPAPPANKSTGPRDVVVLGERVLPPHKVWTRSQTPTHRHEGFHPLSFVPLCWNRVGWHKWIFGLQQRIGFQHYATFWRDDPTKQECTSCGNRHNTSVHGYVAYCHDTHPLVQFWYSTWPNPGIVRVWSQSAHGKEKRIAAGWWEMAAPDRSRPWLLLLRSTDPGS